MLTLPTLELIATWLAEALETDAAVDAASPVADRAVVDVPAPLEMVKVPAADPKTFAVNCTVTVQDALAAKDVVQVVPVTA